MVTPDDFDDRGQLLLVGSVAIALVIVGGVVMINGMLFDDSIGARANDDALADAERSIGMLESDLNTLARQVRLDVGVGSSDFAPALRRNVSLYSRHHTNLTFDNGIVYTNVSFDGAETLNGTVVEQGYDPSETYDCDTTSGYAQFRRGSSCTETDWELATDVTTVNELNVTVLEIQSGGNTLEITVSGSTGSTWTLEIESPSGDDSITISADGTTVGPYGEGTEIRLRDDGRVAIDGTPEFEFAPGIATPYDVAFQNSGGNGEGTAIGGTYYLDSDGGIGDAGPSSTQPEVTELMTNPGIEIYYQRQEVTYNRTILLNETGER